MGTPTAGAINDTAKVRRSQPFTTQGKLFNEQQEIQDNDHTVSTTAQVSRLDDLRRVSTVEPVLGSLELCRNDRKSQVTSDWRVEILITWVVKKLTEKHCGLSVQNKRDMFTLCDKIFRCWVILKAALVNMRSKQDGNLQQTVWCPTPFLATLRRLWIP